MKGAITKALITGSNGFIGTNLVSALLREGVEVRCLVRSPVREPVAGVRYYEIDYADVRSLIDSTALDDVDVVFHLAGVTKALSIEDFRKGNVMPTQHLIDALTARSAPLQRFVLVSSQAAAGPAPSPTEPVTENDPPSPFEDYGRSKLEAENLLREAALPFPYTIVRPATVYGPHDVDFLPLFKQLKSRLGLYPGNRNSYVSLIHVDDLVSGMLLASSHAAAADETYFVTKEVAITWRTIYETVAHLLDRSMLEINLPFSVIKMAGYVGDAASRITGTVPLINSRKIELSQPRFWVCSSEKAFDQIGFQAKIPMREGMASTLAWYEEQGWI